MTFCILFNFSSLSQFPHLKYADNNTVSYSCWSIKRVLYIGVSIKSLEQYLSCGKQHMFSIFNVEFLMMSNNFLLIMCLFIKYETHYRFSILDKMLCIFNFLVHESTNI